MVERWTSIDVMVTLPKLHLATFNKHEYEL